jgi:hypothetical protein
VPTVVPTGDPTGIDAFESVIELSAVAYRVACIENGEPAARFCVAVMVTGYPPAGTVPAVEIVPCLSLKLDDPEIDSDPVNDPPVVATVTVATFVPFGLSAGKTVFDNVIPVIVTAMSILPHRAAVFRSVGHLGNSRTLKAR